MKFSKCLTNKNRYNAVAITGAAVVVQHLNGQFSVHPYETGVWFPANQAELEFSEAPFLEAYEKHVAAKEAEAKEIEQKRIYGLRKAIASCPTPEYLIDTFSLTCVETADHWDQLYKGTSRQAIAIADRAEKEIIDLAIEIHRWEGDFGSLKHRAGEPHHKFFRDNCLQSLGDYQEACKDHFSGDKYFYKSQESEEEFLLEQITEAESIKKVRCLLADFDELIAGYYDCSESLIISDADLNDPDFAGYEEDVYKYNYGFGFKTDSRWTEEVQEPEEAESESEG